MSTARDEKGERRLAATLGALDTVLLSLRSVRLAAEREPIVASIGLARGSVLAVLDGVGEEERATELGAAVAELDLARDACARVAYTADGPMSELLSAVVERLEAVRETLRAPHSAPRTIEQPPFEPDSFLASAGRPSVHTLPRQDRPLPIAWPRSEAMDDEVAAPVAADGWVPWASAAPVPREARRRSLPLFECSESPELDPYERAQIIEAAKAALDEMASLRLLRRPPPAGHYTGVARIEARLLAVFDAFAALGSSAAQRGIDLVTLVLDHAADRAAIDPASGFVRAFCLGSIAGAEPTAAAILSMRQSPVEAREGDREGLMLASGTRVTAELLGLLEDDDPTIVELAVETLAFLRALGPEDAIAFAQNPDPGVAIVAIRSLASATPSAAVLGALEALTTQLADDAVALEAAYSLCALGSSSGASFARSRLMDEADAAGTLSHDMRIAYLEFVSLIGDVGDAELVARSIDGSSEAVDVAGWHGAIALVEPLIALLATANWARRSSGTGVWRMELAVAGALARITGAPLFSKEVAEPSIDLDALSSADRENVLSNPSVELDVERTRELIAAAGHLERDADAWTAWWRDNAQRFSRAHRYRWGRPYSPLSTIDELLDEPPEDESGSVRSPVIPRVRSRGARELALLFPRIRLEPRDWLANQRDALLEMRETCLARERIHARPGRST